MKTQMKMTAKKLVVMTVMLVVLIASTVLVASATSTPMYHVGVSLLSPPVAGRLPDCDVSPNGQYDANVQWFRKEGSSFVHYGEDVPLHAGDVYQAAIHLVAKSGHYFDTDSQFFDCSINGVERDNYKVIDDTHVIIFHEYPALEAAPVESVDITVDTPRGGSTPDFSAEVTGDCILSDYNEIGYINGVFWRDPIKDKILTEEDTLVAGRTYNVLVVIKVDSDHFFDSSSGNAVRINGKTAYITTGAPTPNSDYRVASVNLTAPEHITEMNIENFVTPVVGNTPDFWMSVDVEGVEVREVSWGILKEVDGVEKVVDVDENHKFLDGETYMLCINLENKSDKTFAYDQQYGYALTANLNGKKATNAPWREYDDRNVLQTFDQYKYMELQVWYYPRQQYINNIDILQLPTPVAGETPSRGRVWVAQDDIVIESISWGYIVNEDGYERVVDLEEGETFKKGVSYTVNIRLRNKGNAIFNYNEELKANMVKATVNGKSASATAILEHTGYEYVAVDPYNYMEVYTWIRCNGEVIDNVDIVGAVAPVAGEKPTYDLNFLNTGYYSYGTGKTTELIGGQIVDVYYAKNGVSWYDVTDDEYGTPVLENQAFIGGHRYELRVTLLASGSSKFSADNENNSLVTATVNGEAATVFIRNVAENEIRVKYVFECPIGIIDKIEINIPDPVIGKAPSYDKISTDAYHSLDLDNSWESFVSNNNGIIWFETDNSLNILDPAYGDLFKENTDYSVSICIAANEGYEFADELEVYINGYQVYKVMHFSTTAIIRNDYPITDCIHNVVPVAAIEPTCTEDGIIAHYACDKCNQMFEDANGDTLLDDGDESAIVRATGHNFKTYEPAEGNALMHVAKCTCGYEEVQSCIHEPQYTEGPSEYSKYNATVYICKCGNSGMVVVSPEDCDHELSDWQSNEGAGVHYRNCACYTVREIEDCDYEARYVKGPSNYAERDVIVYTCKVCDSYFMTPIEGVAEPEDELEDEGNTGVSIKVEEGSGVYIPAGSSVSVEPIEENDIPEDVKASIEEELDGSIKSANGYDISILYNGCSLRPGGTVQVSVPYYSVNAEPNVVVYYYDDLLQVLPVNIVEYDFTSQYLTFETDHFSKYVIVTYEDNVYSYLQDFEDAVAALSANASVEAAYGELYAALQLYGKLTDEEKEEASETYETLEAAIRAYNTKAESANGALSDASELALAPMCASFGFLAALWFVLKKKFIL